MPRALPLLITPTPDAPLPPGAAHVAEGLSGYPLWWLLTGYVVYAALVLILAPLAARGLLALTRRTESRYDDVLLRAGTGPVRLLLLIAGARIVLEAAAVPPTALSVGRGILFTLAVVVVLVFIERLVTGVLSIVLPHSHTLSGAQSLLTGLTRGIIFGVGALVILDSLGVSVTPVLGTLGVGSLAVALGLQESLAQIFAGIQVGIDQPIRVGDWVRVEGGPEGWVRQISWRTTRIETQFNTMVFIPNVKIANSIITNFDMPASDVIITTRFQVAYGSDIPAVVRACTETASQVIRSHPQASPEKEPVVQVREFADSGIVVSVVIAVKHSIGEGPVRSELLKALLERLDRDGIVIPYPVRDVRLAAGDQPGAAPAPGPPSPPTR